MQQQNKDILSKLTTIAKIIIFDAKRMGQFLKMMDTKSGAVAAVSAVTGAIEQKKNIPAEVAPLLAVNIYMLMVDMAQDVTKRKANQGSMMAVIGMLLKGAGYSQGQQQQQPPQQPQQQQPPQQQPMPPQGGLITQGA